MKSLLGHAYDVIKVDADVLKTEPWEAGCSLFVMPGGRDLPYCENLNGETNARIRHFVHSGGRYLGFCAGAYYASRTVEFEKGTPMEVVGARELAFFPGISRGTLFPGFVYNSEKGARSASVKIDRNIIPGTAEEMNVYYNGGGYFVQADTYDKVEVLARYRDRGVCKDEANPAAAVYCCVGEGHATLMGVHPEYDVTTMNLSEAEDEDKIIRKVSASKSLHQEFLSSIFTKMGLKASNNIVPEPTPIYLSAARGELVESISSLLLRKADPESHVFTDANDCFHIEQLDDDLSLSESLSSMSISRTSEGKPPVLKIVYPSTHDASEPAIVPRSLTPHFIVEDYFKALKERRSKEWGGGGWYRFGNAMFYADVTTSTQTILDKNYTFAQALPTGLICLASNQIAGRGRGRNSWVSQAGALQFSLVVRHSLSLSHAPVVFIQYLIALAVVESIRTRKGYENVPLRLKWPNDIYADLPDIGLKKVGGLLVNSSFAQDEFLLVIGCGINLSNSQPTISINETIKVHDPTLQRLSAEDVLANILVTFEKFYFEFCDKGMGSWFLDQYYKRWLHSEKLVTLTTHDNVRARIVGITRDYGMLEAVSIDDPRKRFTLQPDGNSFDMLKGLIIKKE
ncbi:biotin holocarboxylase synthetase [Apophysomyces sp. BC1034]|nr:biotin holocarboxylase synthetase [Apophysomyces sp. BC1015]KAG0177280.1 biotin holocarboxylase synthetase [Apophysomyces sp. BC1021]KAG0187044.1 biotin holocarboxylase synthetase [Apophysomyces sp. BC1034]